MNFFEYQDATRRQSRRLILVFILAVVAMVVAIDLLVLLALGITHSEPGTRLSIQALLYQNRALLIWVTLLSAGFIALASLYKTVKLGAGGGQVARDLGGTLLDSEPADPLRRRLRNVVEEIALASGVPVPEIYVLEHEGGINAFAAGYSPADAAIAVTRGTLEKLSRDELQGVIAHEFSHILNGDMRLNIRLMGILFGILLLALIGRRILVHTRHLGRGRNKNGAFILVLALGVMVIGYIGLFFGRWIKAAIARQREYLADASAVQFTRDPQGIAGALKKIAVHQEGSSMEAETEEISHMLFGDARRMSLFSTHPPLPERIRRVDSSFVPEDLDRLRAQLALEADRDARQRRAAEAASPPAAAGAAGNAAGRLFDAGTLMGRIGQPEWQGMAVAAVLAASIRMHVRQAAQSVEWAPDVLFYLVLADDAETREKQLLLIAQQMGHDSEERVRALCKSAGLPTPEQRLPLLELAFPALKRRPVEFVARMLRCVDRLVRVDGRIEVFEFLLARLVAQYLWEAQNPQQVPVSGNRSLAGLLPETGRMIAVLAWHGHQEPGAAAAAYRAGRDWLQEPIPLEMPQVNDWAAALDQDLPRLDRLSGQEKERLVGALISTLSHDGKLVPVELELLRLSCSLIHVPLPMLVPESRQ